MKLTFQTKKWYIFCSKLGVIFMSVWVYFSSGCFQDELQTHEVACAEHIKCLVPHKTTQNIILISDDVLQMFLEIWEAWCHDHWPG